MPQGDHPLGAVEPRASHRPLGAALKRRDFRSLNDPAFDADEYDKEREVRYKRREGLY